jgi:hypothetical protein
VFIFKKKIINFFKDLGMSIVRENIGLLRHQAHSVHPTRLKRFKKN